MDQLIWLFTGSPDIKKEIRVLSNNKDGILSLMSTKKNPKCQACWAECQRKPDELTHYLCTSMYIGCMYLLSRFVDFFACCCCYVRETMSLLFD